MNPKIDVSLFSNENLNLEILAEEAAEVIQEIAGLELLSKHAAAIIQAKSKIIRFGIDDYHPKNKMPNREKLGQEIGHFLAMVTILIENKTVSEMDIEAGVSHKAKKLSKWYGK